ncbi:helix-turn-helix domain-containing protein [Salmonella enterica]|nr:helix-turn-helix domain-containing protein [Salmonella enterica]
MAITIIILHVIWHVFFRKCPFCHHILKLLGAGVSRQQVAIIYDVGLSTLYRKYTSGYR